MAKKKSTKSRAGSSSRNQSGRKKSHKKGANKRWVRGVSSDSTHPPVDLFTKDAPTIARVMATKEVSPKGLGSAIKMVQYFINRGGKGLSASRKRELEKAKRILQGWSTEEKEGGKKS